MIKIGEKDYIEVRTDIIPGMVLYKFPEDMTELLYLHVDNHFMEITADGIKLLDTPNEFEPGAITLHYRGKA